MLYHIASERLGEVANVWTSLIMAEVKGLCIVYVSG